MKKPRKPKSPTKAKKHLSPVNVPTIAPETQKAVEEFADKFDAEYFEAGPPVSAEERRREMENSIARIFEKSSR